MFDKKEKPQQPDPQPTPNAWRTPANPYTVMEAPSDPTVIRIDRYCSKCGSPQGCVMWHTDPGAIFRVASLIEMWSGCCGALLVILVRPVPFSALAKLDAPSFSILQVRP